jgi:hypothetical protein
VGAPARYILSLPERVVRSLGAISGGLLHEIGVVLLPASLRRTTLYRTMVDVVLRFWIEEVGQVEGVYPSEGDLAANFLVQRTAGHGIELLGILTFGASPVWILAALADVTGGGHTLIREISQALKEEGLLPPETQFETVDQLLDGLEKTSSQLAQTLNLPPVNIAGLRRDWEKFHEAAQSIPPKNVPPPEKLEGIWSEMRRTAREQGRSVFTVSSLMAVSALRHVPGNVLWLSRAAHSAARRTGKVLGSAILDHYVQALGEIGRTGFTTYWAREFRPYLRAAAVQFAPEHATLTERLFRRRSAAGTENENSTAESPRR